MLIVIALASGESLEKSDENENTLYDVSYGDHKYFYCHALKFKLTLFFIIVLLFFCN